MSRPTPAPRPTIDRAVWRVGAVTSLGGVLAALDITVVNIAVEPIARDFDATLPEVSWVITGYLLAMAVVLPTSSWLARTWGTRRVYLWSLVAFLVASLLCALAPTLGALVAARVLQGAAGAVLAPVGQMVIVGVTPRASLGHVMGVLAIPILIAPVFGPIVGGLLIDSTGWPSVFLLNLPIGVVAVVAAVKMLPHDTPVGGARLDLRGLLLSGPGLALVLYGLAESATRPALTDVHVLGPLLGGLAMLGLFVLHALRAPSPLLDLRLLGHRAYRAAMATSLLAAVVTLGSILLLPLYLQGQRGESTTAAALLLTPAALGVMVVLRRAGRAADRIGTGPVALLGVVLLALGTIPLLTLDGDTSYPLLCVTMFLRGMGVGMLTGPVTAAAMRSLPPAAVPDASVQLNVTQRLGGSLGTAVFVVLLQGRLTDGTPQEQVEAYGWVHLWVLVAVLLIALPVLVLRRAERVAAGDGGQPPPAAPVTAAPVVPSAPHETRSAHVPQR